MIRTCQRCFKEKEHYSKGVCKNCYEVLYNKKLNYGNELLKQMPTEDLLAHVKSMYNEDIEKISKKNTVKKNRLKSRLNRLDLEQEKIEKLLKKL